MPLCTKKRHKSHFDALKQIKRMKEDLGGSYGTYYCAGCNAYHVTSNVKGNSKFVKFKG